MKILWSLSLLALVSCGASNPDSDMERQVNPYCDGDKSIDCSLFPRVYIHSSKRLPSKIKVEFVHDIYSQVLINECDPIDPDDQVLRGGQMETISFGQFGYSDEARRILITDLGNNCKGKTVFFDKVVTPLSHPRSTTLNFYLNNE